MENIKQGKGHWVSGMGWFLFYTAVEEGLFEELTFEQAWGEQ